MWVLGEQISLEQIVDELPSSMVVVVIKTPTEGLDLDLLTPQKKTVDTLKKEFKELLGVTEDRSLIEAFEDNFKIKQGVYHFSFYKTSLIILKQK